MMTLKQLEKFEADVKARIAEAGLTPRMDAKVRRLQNRMAMHKRNMQAQHESNIAPRREIDRQYCSKSERTTNINSHKRGLKKFKPMANYKMPSVTGPRG